MADLALVAVLVSSFALGLTAHVAIAIGLARRRPRRRALLALVLPPLAPIWALRARLFGRAAVWLGAFAIYAAAQLTMRLRG